MRRYRSRFARLAEVCAALMIAVFLGDVGSAPLVQGADYRERALEPLEPGFREAGLQDCPSAWDLGEGQALAVCRSAESGAPLRLYLLDLRKSGKSSVASRSAHFGDAYYVRISAFERAAGDAPALVLAESGAEFSYGVRVYALDQGRLRFVGEIDEVIDREGTASSVLPALRITRAAGKTEFSFVEPVMRPDGNGGYAKLLPGQVRYVIEGARLRRVRSAR